MALSAPVQGTYCCFLLIFEELPLAAGILPLVSTLDSHLLLPRPKIHRAVTSAYLKASRCIKYSVG